MIIWMVESEMMSSKVAKAMILISLAVAMAMIQLRKYPVCQRFNLKTTLVQMIFIQYMVNREI